MITDTDVMYVYCEVINQLEAQKILDIGMFFKAVGAVSRSLLDMQIPQEYNITGVDIDKIPYLEIYDTIYNRITDVDELFNGAYKDEKYDLITFIGAEKEKMSDAARKNLLEKLIGNAKNILTYDYDVNFLKKYGTVVSVEINGKKFALATVG